MGLWRGFIEEQAGGTLEDLQTKLADQAAFARFARQIIEDLGYGDQLGDDPDAADDEDDEAEGGDEEESPDQQGSEENQEDDSEASPEQSQDQTQDAAEAQVSMDDLADMEMGEEAELPEGEAPLEPPPPAPTATRTRTTRSTRPISTRRSGPRSWPSRPSSNGCAPISTSSSNR
jgi:cobaltochelatase CobT